MGGGGYGSDGVRGGRVVKACLPWSRIYFLWLGGVRVG